jgi:hypothetical protein
MLGAVWGKDGLGMEALWARESHLAAGQRQVLGSVSLGALFGSHQPGE